MQMLKFLAPLAGLVSVALAGYGTDVATTTVVVTDYTTYCPEPTTLVFKNKTITVTSATTLTITDCPCTLACYTPPPVTTVSVVTKPYANKTTTLPPVTVTITYPPTTVLQGVTYVSSKTVTQPGGPVVTLATTKTPGAPVAPTTTPPAVVPPTTTKPGSVVTTAGANKLGSGAAALGLAVVAAMAL
ncbi:hypothetical protein SPI_03080 [Niveomyces insectorum RCEF 264]|uniref:Clock-controlled protein 6 n=1 Tax=Niveomyces insectorum RCEF 264 TaxID=1081102 RepID=A0A167X1X1_9HYPO|nr:hypothetical protein SPI_03080 [Niveomyces insectorum RCEF 264]